MAIMSKKRTSGQGWTPERWIVEGVSILILFFLLLPILVVVPISFSSAPYLTFPPPGFSMQWYRVYWTQLGWVDATILSVWIAVVVTILSTTLGTAAAIGLVRGQFPGKRLMHALILSPLVVPGIIVAIGVYFFYVRIKLVGSPLAIIIAHTALAAPFVVINVSASLYGFNERLEHAALNLGANRWQAFRHVTLPMIKPGMLAGGLLAFITSFDELIIALFVSGSSAVTLPRKMWDSVRFAIEPTLAAVSTVTIVISVAAFLSAEILRRRSVRLAAVSPLEN